MNDKKYDVILKVCDFKTPSKSARKIMDKRSFVDLLKSPEFQDKLKNGKLLGLFTHKGRHLAEQSDDIPYEDSIAISPYFCNVTEDLWIEGDELRAGMMILRDTEYGKKVARLLKAKILVPVSMSVKAHTDFDRYYVDDFYGIDFTFRPDLEAEVLNVNFSVNPGSTKGNYEFSTVPTLDTDMIVSESLPIESNIFDLYSEYSESDEIDIEFTIGTITKQVVSEVKGTDTDANRLIEINDKIRKAKRDIKDHGHSTSRDKILEDLKSEKKAIEDRLGITKMKDKAKSTVQDTPLGKGLAAAGKTADIVNTTLHSESNEEFSIKEYLVEGKMKPYQVFKKRISEVIQFLSTKNQDFIDSNSLHIKQYLTGYIMNWIQYVLNNPEMPFNIAMGLRLNDYVQDRNKLIVLQRLLTRARQQLMKSGSMQLNLQKELNVSYQDVLSEIYSYINHRLVNKNIHI